MTPWTVALQAPASMEFSRQDYWSGLPFPTPGDLPNPEIEPKFPTLAGGSFTTEPPGKPILYTITYTCPPLPLSSHFAHSVSTKFRKFSRSLYKRYLVLFHRCIVFHFMPTFSYLFILLCQVLVVTCRIFSRGM